MNIKLQGSAMAEIITGGELAEQPRWGLRSGSLIIAPYRTGDEHEHHYLETIGSGTWHRSEEDEFRFDKTSRTLRSLWLHVPDRNLPSAEFLGTLQLVPRMEGLLRLTSPQSFSLEPSDYRWLAPDGKVLACIREALAKEPKDSIRLRIAHDFDLLFIEGRLCGWLLWEPARYLVKAWEKPYPSEPTDALISELHDYLDLVAEPNFLRMEDKDPYILRALLDLRERLRDDTGVGQRQVLRESLDYVIEKFYGKVEWLDNG